MERLTDWAAGLLCPVLISNPKGIVLYRNEAAKRCRLGARASIGLPPLIAPEEREAFVRMLCGNRCFVVELPSGEGNRRVLLIPVTLENTKYILFIGFALLQSVHFDRSEGERRLAAIGKELPAWLMRQEPILKAPITRSRIRLYDLHARLLTMYLGDLCADRPESVAILSGLFRRFAGDDRAFCGAAIRAETHILSPESVFVAESGSYLSLLIALIQALVRFGGFSAGEMEFFLQSKQLAARLKLWGGQREMPEIFPQTAQAFAEVDPSLSADFLLLSGICRLYRFDMRFCRTADGMHATVSVPMYERSGLQAGETERREATCGSIQEYIEYYNRFLSVL